MKAKVINTLQVALILCFLPFFMGQEDCEVDEKFKEMLEDKFMKKGPSGTQQDTYVTHLSFMDAVTKGAMVQTEAAQLINEAVVDGMEKAAKANTYLKNNASGHEIPNTDENINTLVNYIFEPTMTPEDKVNAIIQNMMDPNGVDIIVSGQYIDEANHPTIQVRPFIIVKHDKKIITKNLQFKREDFICEDPNSPGTKALCQGARDEISQSVKEMLESI